MENRDINWKKYISYFKYWFLAILVLAVILGALLVIHGRRSGKERTNEECDTTERVFDYADVMSEEQEDALRALIAEKEMQTGCDIVLVTLDESLADYAKAYENGTGRLQPYQYTMIYADNFYDEHKFGYDRPYGDGVLLLDNWYREADGGVYSWLSTCGRAEKRFSSEMIDSLLTEALADVDSDPYGAYVKYVELFARAMTDTGRSPWIPVYVPIFAALLGTGVFVGSNLKRHKGDKTVSLITYVEGGKPELRRREDIFLRKTVTKRRIEHNSGDGGGRSGGGGSHRSGGGVSHGGGGHRR
ncbi:MAG TPA: TPM domain-containing protein [Candidatus Eisenbergiella merdipullorum]|uniref:TPM domain-containing protein n=1 Tax=Candidatus Eisenbergiella merdipullorum TaxID=2838553 RepID=A0A9D2I5V9_9FIRM|nr:TPM domain-containing protein [Candidatus Eisenbergiella merdipullorum]